MYDVAIKAFKPMEVEVPMPVKMGNPGVLSYQK